MHVLSFISGSTSGSLETPSDLFFCRWFSFGSSKIVFRDPSGFQACGKNHLFRVSTANLERRQNAGIIDCLTILAFTPAGQFVDRIPSEVLDCLDAIFTDSNENSVGHAWQVTKLIRNTQFLTAGIAFFFNTAKIFLSALLNFSCRILIEAIDGGNVVGIHIRDFLDAGKTFGGKNLADHLVDIKRFHEEVRAFHEFLLAALRFFLLGEDMDIVPSTT